MERYRTFVRIWDRDAKLTGHRVRAELEPFGEQDGFDITTEISPANESLAAQRYIDAVMEAAEDVENTGDIEVARILWDYAYRLTQEMDFSNPGRDVLLSKVSAKRVLVQRRIGHTIDRRPDVDIIKTYYKMFRENESIEKLNAEEQAARGDALTPLDLAYLHQQLFYSAMEVDSSGDMVVVETTEATVTRLHNDVYRFLYAYTPIDNSGGSFSLSGLFKRFSFNNAPKSRDEPMAKKLLNLCLETVQKSAEHFCREAAGKVYVMNMHQCHLLVERLLWTQDVLEYEIRKLLDLNPILVLRELLQTLLDAQMLIEASSIRTSQWPRAAFEQGDMKDTFSKLLYDVTWHTSVLLSMLEGTAGEFHMKCDGQLSAMDETALLTAMKKDEESLKQRLKSVKVADPIKQELADQLQNQMESPSSDLVFLNPNDFDHKGAGLIGQGAFGAVVITDFLDSKCAMKVINVGHGTEVNLALEMEMNAVKKLGHHPHLVRLFCYSKTDRACYLIMERLHMDLAAVLRLKGKYGHGLSVVEAVDLMLQIGEGLKYIHSKGVAHRDLKPENILINLADPSSKYLSRICSVKIADFGVTKIKEAIITCSHHTRNTGTSLYMAPEVIKLGEDDGGSTRFNPAKADVFSFGIVCSEILTGEIPYGGRVSRQVKEQVKAGTLRPDLPRECPPRLASLIKNCWAGNYEERPLSADICRELRFIKGLMLMYMDRLKLISGLRFAES